MFVFALQGPPKIVAQVAKSLADKARQKWQSKSLWRTLLASPVEIIFSYNRLNYPDEDDRDRRKAIGRVNRFIGCGTGLFRFCTFAFSPSSEVLESYKWV